MGRSLSIAFFVVGIVLIVMGMSALDSFSSDISRFFTGSPTNKAVWLLIGGIILTIVGMSDMFRVQKAK
jgi:hypothetical protein